MRYITEQELRDAFADGVKPGFALPPDAKLTPAAREYLADLRVYPDMPDGNPAPGNTAGASPAALATTATAAPKPEHMAHLTPGELVQKTHPRIVLRGRLDTLEA